MSAVQQCLESNDMTSANSEFLSAFKTLDEEKDSDEESFHLFLDNDDETIKSEDKTLNSELESDVIHKNNEEEEKVVQPVTIDEKVENSKKCSVLPTDLPQDEETGDAVEDEKSTKNQVSVEVKPVTDLCAEKNEEENIENNVTDGVCIKENDINLIQKDDFNKEKNSNVATNSEPMDVEDVSNFKETVSENKIESISNVENTTSMENEDDILNKHDTENNDVEDLDPTLEESLLNDNFEVNDNVCDISKGKTTEKKSVHSNKIEIEELPSETDDNSVGQKKKVKMSTKSRSELESNSHKSDDVLNGSSQSDTEDLLDISMIKDCAQDDADIAEDALQLEQENEDSDGNSRSIQIERMESVDDSSNIDNSDEDDSEKDKDMQENQDVAENCFNKEIDASRDKDIEENSDKEIEETQQKEIEESLDKTLLETTEKEIEEVSDKEIVVILDKDVDQTSDKEIEEVLCEDESIHINNSVLIEKEKSINDGKLPMKRLLANDSPKPEPKKLKLIGEAKKTGNKGDSLDITELHSLISFSKFMTKTHLKQLTRADLEEFCIQKLCEAILHKSELGETNHLLKIQEQTIEVLRKEQTILTKQIKDLDIVNRKLMNEVKSHSGVKPIIPVKITRSVGLQVRMAQGNEQSVYKRRPSQVTPQKTQTPNQNSVTNSKNARITPNNNNVTRQLLPKSPQKPTNSVLNQMLQTRNRTAVKTTPSQANATNRPSPKPKATPEKRTKAPGSFIDLTDEDDKRLNAQNQNSVKTVAPQGVGINTLPKTTMSSVLPAVVSSTTPQVMYVVQSNSQIKQGLLTTPAGQQKAVLVNFQPSNGVINTLNPSSVSVIPKVSPNLQLKTTSKLVKVSSVHPAPLPNPPQMQGPFSTSLKGIPPKPMLSIRKTSTGIILQWRMPYDLTLYEGIASYQLYAYQETTAPPSTDMWRKVGDVKAMALPMACTLTQFADKNKYYFAVRPVDIHKRIGRFSNPEAISL